MDREYILTFLKEHKEELKQKYHIKKMALFGSFARDEADEKSDIDILVDMPSSFDKFFELKYYLEENFNREVDLGKFKTLRLFVKDKIEKEILYV
jgi:predicted nucleotidyltransferase